MTGRRKGFSAALTLEMCEIFWCRQNFFPFAFIAGSLTHKINRISWDLIPGKEFSGNL